MKRADFFIDGVPQIERFGNSDFYKYYQSLKSSITSTSKNIYSYSFALEPGKADPTGSVNFGNSSSNKTFLSFLLEKKASSTAFESVDTDKGVSIHAYANGYQMLKIADNLATLEFL